MMEMLLSERDLSSHPDKNESFNLKGLIFCLVVWLIESFGRNCFAI